MPRKTGGAVDDFFRRTFRDNFSTSRTAFGSEVNDPVRRFDHVQIVLDDQQGVAGFAQFEKHFEQLRHVVKMADPSSARPKCRGSCPSLCGITPSPASRVVPRRRSRSSPAGRAGCSRVRLPPASARDQKFSVPHEKTSPPPPPSGPKHPRCSYPCRAISSVSRVVTLAVAGFADHIDTGRNSSRSSRRPSPSHFSQRPPLTLKLKRPGS